MFFVEMYVVRPFYFSENTYSWEQRELNHFLEVSKKINSDNLYNKHDVLSVSGEFGVVNQIEFQGRSFAGVSVSNYGVVETGDVVYTKSPLKSNPYGIIKTNKCNPGIVSTLYAVYKPKKHTDPNFVQVYFEYNQRLNGYLYPLVSKGAKNDMKISDEKALSGLVYFPRKDEQTAIGNFFKQLDETIALHQRQTEKYQKLKIGFLESVFCTNLSTNNSKKTNDWEQRKLGDFGISTGGTSLESEFSDNGKYKVISIGSYSENSTYTDQNIRTNLTEKTSKRILNKNDLTMILNDKTASGNIIGRALLIDADDCYVYNQRTQRIELHLDIFDPQFIYQLLNAEHIRKKVYKASQGNTQIYVNWSNIKELIYLVPKTKEEQTAIGNFFKQLDETIALHQRQIEKYRLIKKLFLEKMFIK
ncbi:TPA: restriction endonuclease subunit S [Mannheimia haemolytica]